MPGVAGHTARRALYEAMTALAGYPRLVLPAARWTGHGVPLSPDSDIVIEGFPCSANSFTVAAFTTSQPGKVQVAHHLHAPGHVIAAVRRGIPALVLIREPEDAVTEFARTKPALTVAQAARGYVRFYRPLLRYLDRFVVGAFDDVTTDLGSVVRRINERFGTSFAEFEPTEQNLARARSAGDRYWQSRTGPGLPLLGRTAPGGAGTEDAEPPPHRLPEDGPLRELLRTASALYRALAG